MNILIKIIIRGVLVTVATGGYILLKNTDIKQNFDNICNKINKKFEKSASDPCRTGK